MNKKEVRKDSLKKLKNLSNIEKYKANRKISKILFNLIKQNGYKVIMIYIPLKIEPNISKLIQILRKIKKVILVPFIQSKSFNLVKYRLPLQNKKFNIKEPKNSNNIFYKKIDLAIIPIISIDLNFKRIGFGFGMYDRFFEKNREKIEKVIFVSNRLSLTLERVTDIYDISCDLYISPKKILFNKRKKGK